MDRSIPALILAVILLGLFALMFHSWRKRSRRDSSLAAGYPPPTEPGRALASVPALYVATTPRNVPLERLAITGLGFRARGSLDVTDSGLWMQLPGAEPIFVPADAVDLVAPATWAIDRVVETDGLLVVGWRVQAAGAPGTPTRLPTDVDSYFRIVDPVDRGRLVDAIRSIAPRAALPAGPSESEA